MTSRKSVAASRKRQRARRRAREAFWKALHDLADRQLDLTAYTRVIADMQRRGLSTAFELPLSGAQALTIVSACRDATAAECSQLEKTVATLRKKHEALAPEEKTHGT